MSLSDPRPRRAERALRALGRLARIGVLGAIFAVSAYVSFSVFVRGGVTRVPEINGLTEEEATSLLAEQGLLARRSSQDLYDDATDAGRIVRQTPGAGSLVKRGGVVEFALSLGRQLVRMPDLRGQSLASAQSTLLAVGLDLGATPTLFLTTPREIPGAVVLQDPPAGGYVDRARPVTLYLGHDQGFLHAYVMPDLVATSYERARRALETRGLRLGSVKLEPYEGAPPGLILRQFPAAGHPLRHHESVALVVSSSVATGSRSQGGTAP